MKSSKLLEIEDHVILALFVVFQKLYILEKKKKFDYINNDLNNCVNSTSCKNCWYINN